MHEHNLWDSNRYMFYTIFFVLFSSVLYCKSCFLHHTYGLTAILPNIVNIVHASTLKILVVNLIFCMYTMLIDSLYNLRQHFVNFVTPTTADENNNCPKRPSINVNVIINTNCIFAKKLENLTGVHSQNKLKVSMMSFTAYTQHTIYLRK